MSVLADLLRELIALEPDEGHEGDLAITLGEMEDPYDGRIFRDSCNLYEYNSKEGKTTAVQEFLNRTVEFPEYCVFEL